MAFKTRMGKHGQEHLYRISYQDASGDSPVFTQTKWAYSNEHARERFNESCSDDPYWNVVKIETVRQ